MRFRKDEDITGLIKEVISDRSERDQFERSWHLQIAAFIGKQYVQWSSQRQGLYSVPTPRGRVQVSFNRLLPMVRRVVASSIRTRPIWTVAPGTTDIDDEIVADNSTQLLQHEWRSTLSMQAKLRNLLMWRSTCGTAWMRTYWDPFAGDAFSFNMNELKGSDAETRKLAQSYFGPDAAKSAIKKYKLNLGAPQVSVRSPMCVYPDPCATEPCEVRFLTDVYLRDGDYIKSRYGLTDDQLGPPSDPDEWGYWKDLTAGLTPFGRPTAQRRATGRSGESSAKDLYRLDLFCARPTPDNPNGFWAVCLGDKVLRKGDNPEGYPTFPYEMVREIEVPGRLYGECILGQLIGPQRAYNRAMCQGIEYVNGVIQPKWFVPNGSGIKDAALLRNDNHAVVRYNHPMRPESYKVADLPSTHQGHIASLSKNMDDIAAQHQASQGQAPGRVDSASAIEGLQERDDSVLVPTNEETAEALERVGAAVLKMCATSMTEKRLIRIVGENNEIDVRKLTGKDLVGQSDGANYFDVRVELQSSMPLTKPAQQAFARSLIELGLLNPQNPQDKEQALRIMEAGGGPRKASRIASHKQDQRRENREMLEGKLPNVWSFNDHQAHIEEIEEFQRSPEYRKQVAKEGGVDSPLHVLTQKHKMAHAESLQAIVDQQRQQNVQPGTPASPIG